MADYFTGLIGGFQGRRDADAKRAYEEDSARRQQEGQIFQYLLQSQDPEMRALALSGLFESARPGQKKGGLAGYLGELQGGQVYPLIKSRMDQMVPDERLNQPFPTGGTGAGGGPSPPRPGSAAMPGSSPVEPGSAPMAVPGVPSPEVGAGGMAAAPGGAGAPSPGVGMPPPAPPLLPGKPVSQYRRRGTGVPTAEEIAESNAAAGMGGRLRAVTEALLAQGAPPAVVQRAVLGIAGAPPPSARMMAGDQVILADGSGPFDTLWVDGIQTLPDGKPVPPGSKTVAKSSAAGQKTAKEPDPSSPTGWVKVVYGPDGQELYRMPDTPFVPPPAFAGTTTYGEPGTGVPVRGGVGRQGGVTPLNVDEPTAVKSQTQTDAESLKAVIDQRMKEEKFSTLPVLPGHRDEVTKEEAQKLKLPYRRYTDVERATKSTPPVTQRQRTGGGNLAERIRRRVLNPDAPPPGPEPAPGGMKPPPSR